MRWKSLQFMTMLLIILFPARDIYADTGKAVPDPSKTCSIQISYYDDADGTEPVSGAEFTCMRVGERVMFFHDNSVEEEYRIFSEIDSEGRLWKPADNAAEISALAAKAYKKDIVSNQHAYKASVVTGKSGKAVFKGLPHGLYLLTETKPASGHASSVPIILALPVSESDRYVYREYVQPKPQLIENQKKYSRITITPEGTPSPTASTPVRRFYTGSGTVGQGVTRTEEVKTGDPENLMVWLLIAGAAAGTVLYGIFPRDGGQLKEEREERNCGAEKRRGGS